jgi:predicted N-acetyltransferase YhbS
MRIFATTPAPGARPARIRPTRPKDAGAIAALVDLCFPGAARGRTAAILRGESRPIAGLALVAVDEADAPVGSVACHGVRFRGPGDSVRPLVLLGPLVVAPAMRGQRIGARLMETMMAALDARALDCMLIGDAPWYGRFGFSADATAQWVLPGPVDRDRLLLRARDPAGWAVPAEIAPEKALAKAA